MKYISLAVLAFSFIIFSCNTSITMDEKQQLTNEIDTLEFQIYESEEQLLDNRKQFRLVDAYKSYAQKYPQDSLAVRYWFNAAQIQVNLGESIEAIKTLDSLINNFPQDKIIPSALQFKAFIYDDRLGDINEARATLTELITNFPESDLVENAKAYMETLGKSPAEIIVEMEAKAKKAQQENQESK